jgi:hypothetical protein
MERSTDFTDKPLESTIHSDRGGLRAEDQIKSWAERVFCLRPVLAIEILRVIKLRRGYSLDEMGYSPA